MHVNNYRIHFVNGQVIHAAEATEEPDFEMDMIERFREALPDGMLEIGTEEELQAFIPVKNILYISCLPGEFYP